MNAKLPTEEEINRAEDAAAMDDGEEMLLDGDVNAPVEDTDDDGELDLVVRLKKPYTFEGTDYAEIDLSMVERMNADTANALVRIAKKRKKARGSNEAIPIPSVDPDYMMAVAERVTGLPVEFFKQAPAQVWEAVRTKLFNFFMKLA